MIALVDLVQHLSECAGRVVGVLDAEVDNVQESLGLGLEISQSPLVTRVHF